MTTPDESHIKAVIIGLWRQGATPEQIEVVLYHDLAWNLANKSIYHTGIDYVKEVIAKYKPKK